VTEGDELLVLSLSKDEGIATAERMTARAE